MLDLYYVRMKFSIYIFETLFSIADPYCHVKISTKCVPHNVCDFRKVMYYWFKQWIRKYNFAQKIEFELFIKQK